MYFKVECPLELRQLAQLLAPDATPESSAQQPANGVERLIVVLPELPFALRLLRESGPTESSNGHAKPRPVCISGWDRTAEREIESLPDWLAQHIADEVLVTVFVFSGNLRRDQAEPQPIDAVRPHLLA